VKISKFNRESNRQLRINWQCNRFIFGHFNRLINRYGVIVITIDDYPMSDTGKRWMV